MTVAVELDPRVLEHRVELTGYCYRMLGSAFDAEDAVQETLVRAWRAFDRFEGRSSVRSWLYRIATNVCLDIIDAGKRRAMPMDMSPSPSPPVHASLGTPHPENTFVEPMLDSRVLPETTDPAEAAVARESVRLAFVSALQHLPPRQRAVLLLREVLRWKADEVAELLETTTASVNSALQRARATMQTVQSNGGTSQSMDEGDTQLLERYIDAFERYDIDSLVMLLAEDATQSMPPYSLYLQGPADIAAWMLGPGAPCRGSILRPLEVNGSRLSLAQWRRDEQGDGYHPWSIQVHEVADGRIQDMLFFLDTSLFDHFGLPQDPTVR